jgi:hypothetical protein
MTSSTVTNSEISLSRKFTCGEKIHIVHEAYSVPRNISKTSTKWNITRKTIRDWKKILPKLELEVRKNKLTIHPGPKIKGQHLLPFIKLEIQTAQLQCKPLTYCNIAEKLLLLEPSFLNTEGEPPGNGKQMTKLYDWVRRAVKREGFVIRAATHVAQNAISNSELTEDFMTWYHYVVHTYQVCEQKLSM